MSTLQSDPSRTEQEQEMPRATAGQIGRQAALILIVVAVWAVLLAIFLNVTGGAEDAVTELPPLTEPVAPTELAPPTEEAVVPEPSAITHTVRVPTEPPQATEVPTEPLAETDVPPSPTRTEPPPEAGGVSFSAEVLPILTSRCRRCHGGDRVEEGLDLLSYEGVMAGSVNGPVVIPGDSAMSSLVQSIVSGDMPKRAPNLPATEIKTISTWVDEGASDN